MNSALIKHFNFFNKRFVNVVKFLYLTNAGKKTDNLFYPLLGLMQTSLFRLTGKKSAFKMHLLYHWSELSISLVTEKNKRSITKHS